jgi:environmental stress-induced protein Ves
MVWAINHSFITFVSIRNLERSNERSVATVMRKGQHFMKRFAAEIDCNARLSSSNIQRFSAQLRTLACKCCGHQCRKSMEFMKPGSRTKPKEDREAL